MSAFNVFANLDSDDARSEKALEELEEQRPTISFPNSFKIGLSTNDPGLNLTEVVYYVSWLIFLTYQDSNAGKLRMQFFYSILGLSPTKGFDIVIDQQKEFVAV